MNLIEKDIMNSRILIADDDKVQIHLYRKFFSLGKYRDTSDSPDNEISFDVRVFQDGAPLVEFFCAEFEKNRRIPLCILDMRMPSMNGLETAEAVRRTDPEVFIIIATGQPDIKPDDVMKHIKNDVYFLRKPVRTEELLAQTTSLLINWNNQQALKKAYRKMINMHHQLRTILEYSPTITTQQDPDGRYQLVNQRFTDVFGLSSNQVLTQTDEQIFPHSAGTERTRQIRKVVESGKHMEFEEQIPVGNTIRTYLTVRYPIPGEQGDISGIGSMSVDITDRKEMEKELRYLIEKQELSIDLAKSLLKMVNSTLPRYTPLSENLVLFADAIYAPCFREGGDHYFVSNVSGQVKKTVISLKDQSGHEVGCILRSIITDLVHHRILDKCDSGTLEEAMSRLNDEICKSYIFKARDFFTSVNAELDHQTLEMRYVSAGHPRFFLIRGKNVVGLPEQGKPGKNFPIPMEPGIKYSAGVCRLQKGDKLIFYTDGLTSMPRKNKKSFLTFENLESLLKDIVCHDSALSVSDIMMELLNTVSEMSNIEVASFSKNTSDDDITILCFEIENKKDYHERILKANDLIHLSRTIKELYMIILNELKQRGFMSSKLGIRSILAEIISNAWVHGNKQNHDKPVTVRWRYGNDFHIEVADQGEGFNFQNIPDPRSWENINRTYGRGIFIIKHFSDTVYWEENGRHMLVSVRKYPEMNMQPYSSPGRGVQPEVTEKKRRKEMQVTVNHEKDHACFVIKGDIDEQGADILDNRFRELDKKALRELVLDFKDVDYIGSSGIGQLILFYKELAITGIKLRIKNVASDIYDLLLEVDMHTVMTISKD